MTQMYAEVFGFGARRDGGSPHPDRRCSYPIGDFGIHASRLGNAGVFKFVFRGDGWRTSRWMTLLPHRGFRHPCLPDLWLRAISGFRGSANKSGVGPCRIIPNGICTTKTWVMTMKYRVTPEKLADPISPSMAQRMSGGAGDRESAGRWAAGVGVWI